MTTVHHSSQVDRKHALAACRWCRACTEELTSLRDQWEHQSRAIADLQARLAVDRAADRDLLELRAQWDSQSLTIASLQARLAVARDTKTAGGKRRLVPVG